MDKKHRDVARRQEKEHLADSVLRFFDEPDRRTFLFEYEGRRLNALFGFSDELSHTNITKVRAPLRTAMGALKMKIRQPLFKMVKFLDGGEFKNSIYRLFGAKIGRDVFIAPDVYMDDVATELITIGDGTIIGERAAILAHEFSIKHMRLGRVNIGRQVIIGAFSTVRSGVTIGDCSVIGLNSLVTKDVPANKKMGGVPCRELKSRTAQPQINHTIPARV